MIFCTDEKVDAEISRLLGATVLELLRDRRVQEVSANYDPATGACRLFADYGNGHMSNIDATLSAASIIAVTRLLATQCGQSMQSSAPFLSCVLENGFRYHAVLSQLCGGAKLSDGPGFSIRAHPRMIRPLSDFMSAQQAQYIAAAIEMQWTILIAGRTNSGKTTLINALINLIPLAERLLIIEDAAEIQPRAGNVVRRFATGGADLKRHVFESLRDRPDRIIVGEVRGSEARDMLEAAATGHPGLSTIHANGCDEALSRLARLASCDQEFIREAIDLVLCIERMPDGRRVVTQIEQLRRESASLDQRRNYSGSRQN
jgi:Flp pilus assembly CpaF family ATPase